MPDESRGNAESGARGLRVSLVAFLVVIAGLIVLALATSADAPVAGAPQASAPPGAGRGGIPSQIEANLEQGNALIDMPLAAKLAALKGVPVVVNQWASWCPPCRAEFPFFAELAERYKTRVAFLGLNSRDDRGAAGEFLQEHRVSYPSVFDDKGDQARSIGAGASWPTTVFFDAGGTAVFIRRGGYVDVEALDADIRRHALGIQ